VFWKSTSVEETVAD